VNVDADIEVDDDWHGGDIDDDWDGGEFLAGAAVGAVAGAIVADAASPDTVVVGTMVPALPGGCTEVASGSTVVYDCSGVYYQPQYSGTSVQYVVVTGP
jgi:hypothetical protein